MEVDLNTIEALRFFYRVEIHVGTVQRHCLRYGSCHLQYAMSILHIHYRTELREQTEPAIHGPPSTNGSYLRELSWLPSS